MINLIKIELFKIIKGKEKYIIILSFLFMILSSFISISFSQSSYNKEFLSNIYRFFEYNFEFLFPISIGLFSICCICNEFKNKSIKFYLMSKYSRIKILLSKYFALNTFVIITFLITYFLYCIIAYITSDKQPIMVDFQNISLSNLILNLIIISIVTILYINVIISFCILLSYITKKQSLSILLFIIINSLMTLLFGGVYELSVIPRYSFFYASELYSLIWDFNNIHTILRYSLPCISNNFLFLLISTISINNYKYD